MKHRSEADRLKLRQGHDSRRKQRRAKANVKSRKVRRERHGGLPGFERDGLDRAFQGITGRVGDSDQRYAQIMRGARHAEITKAKRRGQQAAGNR